MNEYMIGTPLGGYELNGEHYERYQYDQKTVVTLGPDQEIVSIEEGSEEEGRRVAPSSRRDVIAAASTPFAAPNSRRLHHVCKLK